MAEYRIGEDQSAGILEIFARQLYRHGMVTILSAVVSIFAFRFRSRASLELKLIALQHQLAVLRRQRPSDLSFHLSTGCCGFGCTGFGRRSSTR
jgi:hypothetical protein